MVWGQGGLFWTGGSAKGSEKLTFEQNINEGLDEILPKFERRTFQAEASVRVQRWGTSVTGLRACQKPVWQGFTWGPCRKWEDFGYLQVWGTHHLQPVTEACLFRFSPLPVTSLNSAMTSYPGLS